MIKHFKKLNVEVNSIENWINYKDPDHIVMLSIYLSTLEAENSKIRDRSLSGTRDALENGRYCKSIPKGYMKGKDVNGKPLIQPHPENAPLITNLFNDYAIGLYSQQDILKKYKHTGLNLCRTSLSRLLDNQLYIGLVNVPAYKNKQKIVVNGLHKAIVSKETFFIAQSIKNGKRSKNKVQGKNKAFPLSGFLKCAECGQVLYGSQSNNGKSKKSY